MKHKVKLNVINKYQFNYTNKSLENCRRKLYSLFTEKIWGAGLTDTQVISRSNKEIVFFLCFLCF